MSAFLLWPLAAVHLTARALTRLHNALTAKETAR